MVVNLLCLAVESGKRADDAEWRAGEEYTMATFLDDDQENRMTAFLKYSDEDAKKCKPGQVYKFAITGLGPAKGDKSSYYLRGRVVDGK